MIQLNDMLKRNSTAKIYYEDSKPFLKISPLFVEYVQAMRKAKSLEKETFTLRETAIINYYLKTYGHLCWYMREDNMLQFKDVIEPFYLKRYKKKYLEILSKPDDVARRDFESRKLRIKIERHNNIILNNNEWQRWVKSSLEDRKHFLFDDGHIEALYLP